MDAVICRIHVLLKENEHLTRSEGNTTLGIKCKSLKKSTWGKHLRSSDLQNLFPKQTWKICNMNVLQQTKQNSRKDTKVLNCLREEQK